MRRLIVFASVVICVQLAPRAGAFQREPAPSTPRAVVEAFFAAHTRGDFAAMESMYVPTAAVSLTAPGQNGALAVMTLPVKQYIGWYQGQFSSRTSMRFVVGTIVVHSEGGFATTWIPLEVHETLKDGAKKLVRAVASLHMFRDGATWKIAAHGWQAVSG